MAIAIILRIIAEKVSTVMICLTYIWEVFNEYQPLY